MSDGYALAGRIWTPEVPAGGGDHAGTPAHANDATVRWPMRVILYLHGIQSHGGWFEWSASRLAAAGHIVLLAPAGQWPEYRGSRSHAHRPPVVVGP